MDSAAVGYTVEAFLDLVDPDVVEDVMSSEPVGQLMKLIVVRKDCFSYQII